MEASVKTYNGWTNYETWCVNLWMDNEEGSYRFWRDVAQEIADDVDGGKDDAARDMSDRLKDYHEEAMPELVGFWSDLMGAALSEVNWREIAEHLVDEPCDEVLKDLEVGRDENDEAETN